MFRAGLILPAVGVSPNYLKNTIYNFNQKSACTSKPHREIDMNTFLQGAYILIIGGSGGIGSALAAELQRQGAANIVLASQRSVPARAEAQFLQETVDITCLESVQALATRLAERDISFVLNCAGINGNQRLTAPESMATARREMEVNYFGMLHLASVFAPRLAARGGGTLVHMLSFLSHVNLPLMASYCASKAAAHSLTQALRAEWRPHGVRVCGIYPTAVDTTMSSALQAPKLSPLQLAVEVVAALTRGDEEMFPAEAAQAHAEYLRDPKAMERKMAEVLRT